ncbi:asparagine synthase (glutamine-hydrolyzing) [Polynucleobacter sp. MWH-UH24A]|uniref:asparagine synthase (glutamine-hydrolyzing) n=1 Tax=Polynucleobacter sp. MWH-UH24A TaxID=2689110 RepID=UPI001BFDD743|nr:asparagine synthase (glutamine-hydrolyzing) [Polynucleobacter sp. MWH-UH24A]QWD76431.1 asparagine synthase (glutamine-hydrolyzing) [Polynucleobacter sp. MWH-UH24A]
MCGIAGLRLLNSSAGAAEVSHAISRMTSTIKARGPDGSGIFIDLPIALGHRRLSILDVSDSGAQPMRFRKHGPVISYNGEVYNFRELKQALQKAGHSDWQSYTDTEVVLRIYAEWGLQGLKRLEGIFALAIWDPENQRLVLMRDRFGVKPLFYGTCQYGLAFGSEIKTVLAAGGVNSQLDDQTFSEYLWYGNSYGDRTFYKGIQALQPGHWLIIEKGIQILEAWWRIEEWLEEPFQLREARDAAELVREALDRAVARQLIADVPIGLFLSGGVDSSAIAASAMQNRFYPIQSFSAGFDFERGVNELPKAALVAKKFGLDHNELRIQGGELESVLMKLARAHDEPFADAANIPLYLMSQQLQGQIKVVLQGDGGDELFAGYRRYAILRNAYWWQLWPRSFSSLLHSRSNLGRRFVRIADSVGNPDPALRMAYLLTVETPYHPPELVFQPERRQHLQQTVDPFLAYRKAAQRFKQFDPVKQMLLTDLTVQLPAQFLTKVDRATMAAGVEARVPMLDEGVARLAIKLPSSLNVNGWQKKIVLRDSQRGRLPASILDGPKTGFNVPYGEWLRTSLYEFAQAQLLDKNFLEKFEISGNKLESMLVQHHKHPVNQGFMLWKLLQLAIWHSEFKY